MTIAIISALCGGLAAVITAVATAYTSHVVAKYKAQEEESAKEKESLNRMLTTEREFSDRLLRRVHELESIIDQKK
jgi:Primosomal replication protein priC